MDLLIGYENTGPHGLPDYGKHLYVPQIQYNEDIQHGYGGCIPAQAGGKKRAGQGADH